MLFWSAFFSAFGLNTERYGVSRRIQSECGKMRTRITSNTDTFQAMKGSKCLLSNAKFVLQKVLTCENFSGKGRFQKIVIYIILIKSYFLTKPPGFFKKITEISLYFNHQVNGYVFNKIIPLNLRKYELHLLWANHYRFEGAMNSSLGPILNKICFYHYEKIWLENCPLNFYRLSYNKRYLGENFVEHLKNTLIYFKSTSTNATKIWNLHLKYWVKSARIRSYNQTCL